VRCVTVRLIELRICWCDKVVYFWLHDKAVWMCINMLWHGAVYLLELWRMQRVYVCGKEKYKPKCICGQRETDPSTFLKAPSFSSP